MLFAALLFSGVLLIIANRAAARSRRPGIVIFSSGFALTVFPICGMTFYPAVPLLTLIFCLLLLTPRSRYRQLSALSFALVIALLSLPGFTRELDYSKWRSQYPLESIEERLPISASTEQPPTFDLPRLTSLEERIQKEAGIRHYVPARSEQLRMIHEGTIWRFVNSRGFGQARMFFLGATEKGLEDGLRDEQPVPQPLVVGGKLRSVDTPDSVVAPELSTLDRMNQNGVVDFVHSAGCGYVKDRRHVAGFQAHQFSKVPEADGKLRVASVELIGWLRGSPAVYVSDNLPAMKELRNAPTRPLDEFEAEGLTKLRQGEDLFIKSENGGVRLLGSIRATKQCVDCHGGQRGDLLGAFSYQLR